MKKLLTILLLLPLFIKAQPFGGYYLSGRAMPGESAPQIVTDKYIAITGVSLTQARYIKSTVQSLEDAGMYFDYNAIWICINDTETAKINLVDPFKVPSAFYVTYVGNRPSYLVNTGIQWNGGWGETNIDFLTITNYPLSGAGFYTKVATAQGFYTTNDGTMNLLHNDGGKIWCFIASGSSGVTHSFTGGLISMQRPDVLSTNSYINGSIATVENNSIGGATDSTLRLNFYNGIPVSATNTKGIMYVRNSFNGTSEVAKSLLEYQIFSTLLTNLNLR